MRLELYIKDKYIAECISKSKYPYIIAAIGKIESDYRPQVWGDHGESYGMFQIQQRHHGRVGETIPEQVAACERILSKSIRRHGVATAVQKYNGAGRAARIYRLNVLNIAAEIQDGKKRKRYYV